jgi:ATP-binding cassette subfamily B protein
MKKINYRDITRFSWHYWSQHKLLGIGAIVALMISVAIDVAIPVLTGRIVDALAYAQAGDPKAFADAKAYFWGFTAAAFGHYFFWLVAFKLWTTFALHNLHSLLGDALAKVQRFSAEWHANSFAGATVRKITRGMWSFDVFEDTIFMGFIPAVVIMIGMTLMLILQVPLIGIFAGVMIVILVSSSVFIAVKIQAPLFRQSAAMDTQVGATIADMMTGISTIKSFASEQREDARFFDVSSQWKYRAMVAWQKATNFDFVRSLIRMLLLSGMLGLTIYLWSQGKATTGDIALSITASFMIGGYLRDIGRHVTELQRAASEIEDVVGFWLRQDDIRDAAGAETLTLSQDASKRGDIVFDRVAFGYTNVGQKVYENLNVHIKPGEKIALVGVSGSGKSTFVKLLQRLYDINEGEIRIDGQNIARVTQESLRQAIALVPQEPILFHRSLAENIAYGRIDAGRDEIEVAAREAYAHDFIATLPHGYETLVGERGVKLSGGERQRVAIARAILADKPILILDEATSSLDSVSEHYIQLALERLMKGRTTITIAHRLATIQNADRILVFDKGQIVEEGSHAVLLARPGSIYKRLYDMQALDLVGPTVQA